MKEHIFVYGLFRDSGKSQLGNVTFCGKASVGGKLYFVNEFYPGIIIGDEGKVWGDVYLIDSSILPQLDKYEGYEYTRTKTKTSNDIECWIYEYKYDVTAFKEIIGGDWMLR